MLSDQTWNSTLKLNFLRQNLILDKFSKFSFKVVDGMVFETRFYCFEDFAWWKVGHFIASIELLLLLVEINKMIFHCSHFFGFWSATVHIFENFVKKESCLFLNVFFFCFFKDLFIWFEFFRDAIFLKLIYIAFIFHSIIKESLDVIFFLAYKKLQILNSLLF